MEVDNLKFPLRRMRFQCTVVIAMKEFHPQWIGFRTFEHHRDLPGMREKAIVQRAVCVREAQSKLAARMKPADGDQTADVLILNVGS